MIRKIIHIDEEKCNGCGLCAQACQEGAIALVEGKAKLMRDDYCDGLGNCLPACPTNAITFIEREAAVYDEAAVKAAQAAKASGPACPGSAAKALAPENAAAPTPVGPRPSRLNQWPVQIKLAPLMAPYFDRADLLIAADCTAFACGNFHEQFMRDRITLVGCPKLDGVDYAEKLAAILAGNDIRSLLVVRMEVPCCGGLERAVQTALARCGKWLPCQVVTLSLQGEILP